MLLGGLAIAVGQNYVCVAITAKGRTALAARDDLGIDAAALEVGADTYPLATTVQS